MDYTGIKCPVCEQPFTKQDDIVVCPECGAPYHRECYRQEDHCLFEEKHASGEAWETSREAEGSNTEKDTKRCPRCGKENNKYTLFCDHCGMSLSEDPSVGPQNNYGQFHDNPQYPGQNQVPPQNGQNSYPGSPFFGGMPFVLDPMGGVNPNEDIDDVSAGEIAKLVQNNTSYYLPVFMNYKRNRKNRFNFCAFLFTGGWFLYRKQYKWGSILTAVMLLIYGLSSYFTYVSEDILLQLMGQAGIDITNAASLAAGDSLMKFQELLLLQPPFTLWAIVLPHILGIIQFIIMLIVGFIANKMYLKHCTEKIHKIHDQYPVPEEKAMQLQNQGGVNTAVTICLLVGYMILFYLPNLFI